MSTINRCKRYYWGEEQVLANKMVTDFNVDLKWQTTRRMWRKMLH